MMAKAVFNNSSEAYRAGYTPVNFETDKIAEHRYFSKTYENPAGQKSVIVRLKYEPTTSGAICQYVPMYPPKG